MLKAPRPDVKLHSLSYALIRLHSHFEIAVFISIEIYSGQIHLRIAP